MNARDRIFQRLQAAQVKGLYPTPDAGNWYLPRARGETADQRTERFVAAMTAARTEIHRVTPGNWVQKLYEVLSAKGIGNILLSPDTDHGRAAQEGLTPTGIACQGYDHPIEEWKEELFNDVQSSLTLARSGIAETGTLILWPDAREPRLMSLVPPVHIVLLDACTLHATFHEAMTAENWASGMPTNALLISSPSKTADIQQTLAYGAHGPKELVVLLRECAQ